jgi:hypothetical protein
VQQAVDRSIYFEHAVGLIGWLMIPEAYFEAKFRVSLVSSYLCRGRLEENETVHTLYIIYFVDHEPQIYYYSRRRGSSTA